MAAPKYTDHEDALIIAHAESCKYDERRQAWLMAQLPGRAWNGVLKRAKLLSQHVPGPPPEAHEPTPAQVVARAANPSSDPGELIRRNVELEAEVAMLRQQLAWSQRAAPEQRTGGVLTVRASDHHHADLKHLIRSCAQAHAKVRPLVSM
ncbi:MAG: hypothetical protein KIT11_05445 [Fimbriimonadaceae bacterium]|nr:hypothetical protein [Fimbriimonadaceae bacterium]QYK56663.1 MAG: hypothetical protein KF733_04075 [Fimbriimonadaceae bacterium]